MLRFDGHYHGFGQSLGGGWSETPADGWFANRWSAQANVSRAKSPTTPVAWRLACLAADVPDGHDAIVPTELAAIGRKFPTQALGCVAAFARHSVRFVRRDNYLQAMAQATPDNWSDLGLWSLLTPGPVIPYSRNLRWLTAPQSAHIYRPIRQGRRSSILLLHQRWGRGRRAERVRTPQPWQQCSRPPRSDREIPAKPDRHVSRHTAVKPTAIPHTAPPSAKLGSSSTGASR